MLLQSISGIHPYLINSIIITDVFFFFDIAIPTSFFHFLKRFFITLYCIIKMIDMYLLLRIINDTWLCTKPEITNSNVHVSILVS